MAGCNRIGRTWRSRVGQALALAALPLGLTLGCAGGSDGDRSAGRDVDLEDFVQVGPDERPVVNGEESEGSDGLIAATPGARVGDPAPRDTSANESELRVVTREQATGGDVLELQTGSPLDLSAPAARGRMVSGNPLGAADDAALNGVSSADSGAAQEEEGGEAEVAIDRLVGQINGRPVFASDFFEPLDARLRAEARRVQIGEATPEQWLSFAKSRIGRELRGLVRDELLLAEFEASLSPQERQGLLTFVRNLRETLISENLGSETLANRRFSEEEGKTLEEMVKSQRNEFLIKEQLRRAVADRVYVSWRDVQMEYERRYDEFNPSGEAVFRMIWVNADDAVAIDEVETKLAAGVPFAEVAAAHSFFKPSEGGLYAVELSEAGYEETPLFQQELLENTARELDEGEFAGPIRLEDDAGRSDRLVWLKLEGVVRDQRTLAEAQLEIHDELRAARWSEENAKYLEKLITEGSVTDINDMEIRLLQFAADRYLIAPSSR